jgi:hypothetical protein
MKLDLISPLRSRHVDTKKEGNEEQRLMSFMGFEASRQNQVMGKTQTF